MCIERMEIRRLGFVVRGNEFIMEAHGGRRKRVGWARIEIAQAAVAEQMPTMDTLCDLLFSAIMIIFREP